MPTMLVLGAGSGIARAAVREFAAAGWDFQLAGRDMGALEAVAAALPAGAPCFLFDAEDEVSRAGLWPSLPTPPDALLCAVGRLGDQARARTDHAYARALVECNFTGLVPILGQAAADFEARGSGLDHRDKLGGRGPGPGVQLRLRRGQGGLHGLPRGAAGAPLETGRPRPDGQAGLTWPRA